MRDPAGAVEEMVRSWESGEFVSEPELPDWPGPAWSLLLIPGWRELRGQPLERIVAHQWTVLAQRALDDLEAVSPERWAIVDFDAMMQDPRRELRRVCDFTSIVYDQALLAPVEAIARVITLTPPQVPETLRMHLDEARDLQARVEELCSSATASTSGQRTRDVSPFHSSFTAGFPRLLGELAACLLISTYQSGRLICARARGAMLNTHLRDFELVVVGPVGVRVEFDWPEKCGTNLGGQWDFREHGRADPPQGALIAIGEHLEPGDLVELQPPGESAASAQHGHRVGSADRLRWGRWAPLERIASFTKPVTHAEYRLVAFGPRSKRIHLPPARAPRRDPPRGRR